MNIYSNFIHGSNNKMLLLVLLITASCRGGDWEELLSEKGRNDHLDIYSEIPGTVTLRPTKEVSEFSIKAKVNHLNDEEQFESRSASAFEICDIQTKIKEGRITITVLPKIEQTPETKSFQHSCGFPLVYSYILTLFILVSVHGCRAAITYGVLLSTVFAFANVCLSNITRIDILVEYSQNEPFKTISINMKDGNISVPNQTTTELNCGTGTSTNISGCPSCCYGNGMCGIGNRCYCEKGYDEKTNCKLKKTPRHTMFLNPIDKRVIHVQLQDNLNATVYGRKTIEGRLRSIQSFRTRDKQNRNSNVFMGKLRKISKVITSSGTTISFDWKTKCNVHVTVLFNKGQGQLDQDITVCKLKHTRKENSNKVQTVDNILPSDVRERISHRMRSGVILHRQSKDFIKIPVEIKSCNEPDSSAEVSASIKGTFNNVKVINNYIGSMTADLGVYHVKLPVRSVNLTTDFEDTVCRSFKHGSDHLCKYVLSNYIKFKTKICKDIKSSIMTMSNVLNVHIVDVLQTCESSFQTVIEFCKEFYDDIHENCNRENIMFYDSFVPGDVSVQIMATFPGDFSVKSNSFQLQVKENASFTTDLINLNDIRPKPRFIGFSVNPRDPRPFQRYNVTINFACASSTTKVDMRIIGSDNYHNNVTCFGVTECNCCVLHVAGGAAHVMDKVIVTLNDPLTQTVTTREIAVLF